MAGCAFEAFVGDAVYPLALNIDEIRILEATLTRLGLPGQIHPLHVRFKENAWFIDDIIETIKVGLIGGGMSHERARRHVDLYITSGRLNEYWEIAHATVIYALAAPEDDPVPDMPGEPQAQATTTTPGSKSSGQTSSTSRRKRASQSES